VKDEALRDGVAPARFGARPGNAEAIDRYGARPVLGSRALLDSGRRYRYVADIARGGMGRVIEVADQKGQGPLAMKVLPISGTHRVRLQRFLEEARTIATLKFAGVLPVYDAGVYLLEGRPHLFYTMDRVMGPTLRDEIQALHRLADAERQVAVRRRLLALVRRACQTVDHAHQRQVLHCDLKPANLLCGPTGEVWVIDWGIAETPRRRRAQRRRVSPASGTPDYMAPELVRDGTPSVATDVYALGAIIYSILCGAPPYGGRTVRQVLEATLLGPPPSPTERAPRCAIPPALESLCLRAMARQPADRTPTARALSDDIGAWLGAD
jgi:serine/threonine-protein kinase